jgi:hypothetical protein
MAFRQDWKLQSPSINRYEPTPERFKEKPAGYGGLSLSKSVQRWGALSGPGRVMAMGVCTENLIRVGDVMESPKLAE